MKYLLGLSLLVSVFIPIIWSLKPAPSARETFSTNFYRTLVTHLKKKTQNYIISPAAVQKMLILIYNGAEENIGEPLLFDLFVKQVNFTHVRQLSANTSVPGDHIEELFQKEVDELKKQHIAREDVLNFFENDFTEIKDKIILDNYLVVYNGPEHSPDFGKFAKDYFNTTILHHTQPVKPDVTPNMVILTFAALQAKWKIPFSEVNETLTTKGRFKIGVLPLRKCQVVELPLQADEPLTMMIFTPNKNDIRDFFAFLDHMGKDKLSDFNIVSRLLNETDAEVKLPAFNIVSSTNVTGFFDVEPLFRENVMLKDIFPNITENGLKVNHFEQAATFQLDANGIGPAENILTRRKGRKSKKGRKTKKEGNHEEERKDSKQLDEITPTQTFDVTGQPFFFVIKSKEVLYFMGHYAGK